ncbi:hypothetical protein D3C87_1271660 [compost metagenome]
MAIFFSVEMCSILMPALGMIKEMTFPSSGILAVLTSRSSEGDGYWTGSITLCRIIFRILVPACFRISCPMPH